jgi:hypothetical protein
MTDDERAARLTDSMRFERRSAVTPREKAVYTAVEASCADAVKILRRLHLRLWHASRGEYRSLPMDDVSALLKEAGEKIDAALEKCPRGGDILP